MAVRLRLTLCLAIPGRVWPRRWLKWILALTFIGLVDRLLLWIRLLGYRREDVLCLLTGQVKCSRYGL